jgi:hypothetical protein
MSVPSSNAGIPNLGGIYGNITQLTGSDQQISQAQQALWTAVWPPAGSIYKFLNALPPGELKNWLTAGPQEFYKKLIQLFTGKKWTSGDYVLGERLNDNVYGQKDIGRQQVTDDMVAVAHTLFNQLFGVRIATSDDLDALDNGIIAYKARQSSQGISQDAIERAVFLKQHFYPSSTYNKVPWDLRYFEVYPLVDRIPAYEPGKWFTGEVIGGGHATEGIIEVSAANVLQQFVGADFNPATGTTTLPDGTVLSPGSDSSSGSPLDNVVSYVKANPMVLGLVLIGGYFLYEEYV